MYPPYDVTRIPGQKALARFPRASTLELFDSTPLRRKSDSLLTLAEEVALQQGIPNVKALDQYRKAYCEVQYAKALAKSKGVEVKSQSQEGGSAVAEEQTNRTRPVKVEGKEKQKRVD